MEPAVQAASAVENSDCVIGRPGGPFGRVGQVGVAHVGVALEGVAHVGNSAM